MEHISKKRKTKLQLAKKHESDTRTDTRSPKVECKQVCVRVYFPFFVCMMNLGEKNNILYFFLIIFPPHNRCAVVRVTQNKNLHLTKYQ